MLLTNVLDVMQSGFIHWIIVQDTRKHVNYIGLHLWEVGKVLLPFGILFTVQVENDSDKAVNK